MKKLVLVILVLNVLGSLVACSSENEIPATSSGKSVTQESYRSTPVVASTNHTFTSTPNFEIIPTQTWTPLPTLNQNDGRQMLKAWFTGSDFCRLPCWGGIIPGITSWEEAKHILNPLQQTIKLKPESNVDCVYGKCSFISWSRLPNERGVLSSLYPENIIDYIMLETIEPGHLTLISLQNILAIYGKPTILLISTDPDQPGQKFLELILVYPEKQFLIKYSKYAEINESNIESCGRDSYIKLVILGNSEQLRSLDAIANAVETKDFHVDIWHKTVEEAIGISIETFYKTYKIENAPCISTPINIWQP